MRKCAANIKTQPPGNSDNRSRQSSLPNPAEVVSCATSRSVFSRLNPTSRSWSCQKVVSHQSRAPANQSALLCVFSPWRLCVENLSTPARAPVVSVVSCNIRTKSVVRIWEGEAPAEPRSTCRLQPQFTRRRESVTVPEEVPTVVSRNVRRLALCSSPSAAPRIRQILCQLSSLPAGENFPSAR